MFKRIIHYYRLNRIVRELPFYIGRAFGAKDSYNANQVSRTFKKYHFSPTHLAYAYALLSNKQTFNKAVNDKALSYDSLRKEVAEKYFSAKYDFSFNDLMRVTRFKGQVFSYDGSGSSCEWHFHRDCGGDGGGGDS